MRTRSACFAVLRQLRGICRSVPRTVFQSLVSCLVLPRLDYCNSVLDGITLHFVRRLQSVMNAAARLVFSSSKCDHITPHLRQLHWLTISWRTEFKLAVLVNILSSWSGTVISRRWTSSSSRVGVSKASVFRFVSWAVCSPYPTQPTATELFQSPPVRIWNSLPQHVTSAPSLPVFCTRLKTYFFELCYL